MNGTAAVEQDRAYPAGHAVIRIHGGAQFTGPVGFRIRRDDYNEGVFGPNGWQVADALLTPDQTSVGGADLLLHVGPGLVQHIVNGVYQFALPAAQLETTIFWPDLPLLADGAANMVAEPARVTARVASSPRPQILRRGSDKPSQPEAMLRGTRDAPTTTEASANDAPKAGPTTDSPGIDPDPAPIPPPRRWAAWMWAPLVLVLVALVAGGYAGNRWWWHKPPVVAQTTPANPTNPPSGRPTAGPAVTPQPVGLDLEHMTVMEASRSGAPPEALLREAERRMHLGGTRRNDALLLMQMAADKDYAPAHAALGRLYDPNLPRPPEFQPDARQAALHYHAAAAGGDHAIDDARAALKAHLENQAQGGSDLFAPVILQKFWP